ncbi:hypothetical protein GX51_05975 [Blastomyces parvus]|uniref:Uncharacterized protein n=1 Tax=Blastomyces parvus TaxID=2060905 RepID=A0A2B7WUD4_9EURO|nr:hypothetical protein GX51_05975 [Blastomyces parvus]
MENATATTTSTTTTATPPPPPHPPPAIPKEPTSPRRTRASTSPGQRADTPTGGSPSGHKRNISSSFFSRLSLSRSVNLGSGSGSGSPSGPGSPSSGNGNGIGAGGGGGVGTDAAQAYAQRGGGQDIDMDMDMDMGDGGGGLVSAAKGVGGGISGGGGAMASALQQQQQRKTRRRKGSLRKTALLGTGALRAEGRRGRERERGVASALASASASTSGSGSGSGSGSSSLASSPVSSPLGIGAVVVTKEEGVDAYGEGRRGWEGSGHTGGSAMPNGYDNDTKGGAGEGGGLLRFPPLPPSVLNGDEEEALTPQRGSHDQPTTLPPSLSAAPNLPPAPSHSPPPIPPPPSRTWVAQGSSPSHTQQKQYQEQPSQEQEQLQSNTPTHPVNDKDDEPELLSFSSNPRQTQASTPLTRLASNASTTTTISTISTTPTTSSSNSNSNSYSSSLGPGTDTRHATTTMSRRVLPFKISTPSSSSDSYFPPVPQTITNMSSTRFRSTSHRVKSPLSLSGVEPPDIDTSAAPPSATTTAPPSISGVSGISVSDDFPNATAAGANVTATASASVAAAAATAASSSALEEAWDYAETEWWGWIILLVTWLVFVVGMGSCLGVWSWAWDVGETPYAPPELEDDATLPIVGYYPALIICTAVMAWVWVIVAWVGMKYFRHANISGEDI